MKIYRDIIEINTKETKVNNFIKKNINSKYKLK
jgi:hypothetical protein